MGSATPKGAQVAVAIAMIMGGCCTNVYFVEALVQEDKLAGTTMTFCAFLFMTLEGLPARLEWPKGATLPQLRKTVVPLQHYVLLTGVFAVLSVINNFVFALNISMPIHTLVRSSSLLVSLVLGLLFFGKRYTGSQILGVATLTMGIFTTLTADARVKARESASGAAVGAQSCEGCDATRVGTGAVDAAQRGWAEAYARSLDPLTGWAVGVALLFFALVLSAVLGHLQRQAYERHTPAGEVAPHRENMFYSHMLALPAFALFYDEIASHLALWAASEPYPWLPGVPRAVLLGALTTVTQYICIRGVFVLMGLTSALTCTLTITLRKFVSLVVSVLVFHNPFSPMHWVGTLLVFAGVFTYSGAVDQLLRAAAGCICRRSAAAASRRKKEQ